MKQKKVFPKKDGYYWLRNRNYWGECVWRIIEICSPSNIHERIAIWHRQDITEENISRWKDVRFVGPLKPPHKTK